MTTSRAAGILLAKELRLEFRTRELLTTTVIFALVVVVLFSFAFEPTAAESRRYGPGLLWIAFLFAGSLMLNPSFAREQSNETLDALRMAPIAPFAILLGKMLANFVFLAVAEAILVPVFAVLYNVSFSGVAGRLISGAGAWHVWARHHWNGFFCDFGARAHARTASATASTADPDAAADRVRGSYGVAPGRTAGTRPHLGRISRGI